GRLIAPATHFPIPGFADFRNDEPTPTLVGQAFRLAVAGRNACPTMLLRRSAAVHFGLSARSRSGTLWRYGRSSNDQERIRYAVGSDPQRAAQHPRARERR